MRDQDERACVALQRSRAGLPWRRCRGDSSARRAAGSSIGWSSRIASASRLRSPPLSTPTGLSTVVAAERGRLRGCCAPAAPCRKARRRWPLRARCVSGSRTARSGPARSSPSVTLWPSCRCPGSQRAPLRRAFIRVDLPAPFGPTRATLRPRSMVRSRPVVDRQIAVALCRVLEPQNGAPLRSAGGKAKVDRRCVPSGGGRRSIFSSCLTATLHQSGLRCLVAEAADERLDARDFLLLLPVCRDLSCAPFFALRPDSG